MKYEHQINWADAYNANLDGASSGLSRNGLIYLFSTVQSVYRNGWQILKCVLCTTVKNEPIHTISYELNECMPWSLPSLPSLFLLVLLL